MQQNNVLRWGVFPGKYFYIADFFEAAYKVFPRRSLFHWPQSLGLFVEEEMLILVELDKLQNVGKEVFAYYFLNQKRKKALLQSCRQEYKALQKFFTRFPDVTSYSREALIQFGLEIHEQILEFWLVTFPIELANYGSWALLEDTSKAKNWQCSLVNLVALEWPTFYQKEELELVATRNIETHQQKYFWLKNNYHHTEILPVEFFTQRKLLLKPTLLKKQDKHFKQIKVKKLACIQECHLSAQEIAIVDNVTLGLWLQEQRKQYILQIQHYKELFLRAAQSFLPDMRGDYYQYSLKEIISLLLGKSISSRSKSLGVSCKSHQVRLLSSLKTQAYWQIKTSRQEANHLQGKVLVSGAQKSITGFVRFFDVKCLPGNLENNIVVVRSIAPEYVDLLRSAKAIILESFQTVTHTLLSALAHTYLGKLPSIVVISDVAALIHADEKVLLRMHDNYACLSKVSTLQGSVASSPSHITEVKGKVYIVKSQQIPKDLTHVILVVPYLSLESVLVYRHARCIITNQGGITSHGAIICRELGIPCVVGVKNATQLLINGQKIVVDLRTGVIEGVGSE